MVFIFLVVLLGLIGLRVVWCRLIECGGLDMELLNVILLVVVYNQGFDVEGWELLVVIVKGSFDLLLDGCEVCLLDEQQVLLMVDEFYGELGFFVLCWECEFVFFKLFCDVLVLGSVQVFGGWLVQQLIVGICVGWVSKVLMVYGLCQWELGLFGVGVGVVQLFQCQDIFYVSVFGGSYVLLDNFGFMDCYMVNLVGCGWFLCSVDIVEIVGMLMLVMEKFGELVDSFYGCFMLMVFGLFGCYWQVWVGFVGCYDDVWLVECFLFLFVDFDECYFQFVLVDQWIDYLCGGEEVLLFNFIGEECVVFCVLCREVLVIFFLKKGGYEIVQVWIDILLVDCDVCCVEVIWCICWLLKCNLFEVVQVLVGSKFVVWWCVCELGKDYYFLFVVLVCSCQVEEDEV